MPAGLVIWTYKKNLHLAILFQISSATNISVTIVFPAHIYLFTIYQSLQ